MKCKLRDRLLRFGIDAKVQPSQAAKALENRTWLALTSSHLGRSSSLHVEVCRYISRAMLDARQSGEVLVIASGSAIEPWAERAAELYSVPMIRVHVDGEGTKTNSGDQQPRLAIHSSHSCSRDAVVVAIADRVDCVFARPRGNIENALRMRLDHDVKPSMRVAVHDASIDKRSHRLTQSLMGCGAIGWYCRRRESGGCKAHFNHQAANAVSNDWITAEQEWLVHCTRACDGPWAGQTDRQHRDELLLGGSTVGTAMGRTPLDSLRRILRMRRIIGSAITSDRAWPVVCFSQQPLATLLSQRSYRPHLHRWDYEPYGIAIRKDAAIAAGFQPVIYASPKDRKRLAISDRYRFQAVGKTFDWTREREWRCAGDVDLNQFDPDDIRVFVAEPEESCGLNSPFGMSVVGQSS